LEDKRKDERKEKIKKLLEDGFSIKHIYEVESKSDDSLSSLNVLFYYCIVNNQESKLKQSYTLDEYLKFIIEEKLTFRYLNRIYSNDELKKRLPFITFLKLIREGHIDYEYLLSIYTLHELRKQKYNYTPEDQLILLKSPYFRDLQNIFSLAELKDGLLKIEGFTNEICLLTLYTDIRGVNFIDLFKAGFTYDDITELYKNEESKYGFSLERKDDFDTFRQFAIMKLYENSRSVNNSEGVDFAVFFKAGFTYGDIKELYKNVQNTCQCKKNFDTFKKSTGCRKDFFGKTDINCTYNSIKK
jgi:DNA-binding transcriptional MerR regulator